MVAAGLVAVAALLAFLGLVFAREWLVAAVALGVALVAGGNAWAAGRTLQWFGRGRPGVEARAATPGDTPRVTPPPQPVLPHPVPPHPAPPHPVPPRPAPPAPVRQAPPPAPVAPPQPQISRSAPASPPSNAPTVPARPAPPTEEVAERPTVREAARAARVRTRTGGTGRGRRVAGNRPD